MSLLNSLKTGNWRVAVVYGQLTFSVALYVLLALLILLFQTDAASVWILLMASGFNLMLLLSLSRFPSGLSVVVVLDVVVLVLAMVGIEALVGTPQVSIWATVVMIPMIGTFLGGHQRTGLFLFLSVVGLIALGSRYGVERLIDVVAASGVAMVVAGLGWVAEGARVRAETLAQAREEALAAKAREATAASEARTTFLATMSHEIRTPMNGVLGLTRVLLETPLTAEQAVLGQTILSSGQSLMTVLNDVLDFSRLEAGRMIFEALPLAPRSLAQEVLDLLHPLVAEKNLVVRLQVDPVVPAWIHGDPTRLRQILLNIVGNALKFTAEGWVEIRLRYADTRLRIEVQDTGIGIPEAQQATLFDAFTQADSTTTRRFGGSGLGLAICRQLCTHMGGTLGLTSVPGSGSTFWFELPYPACEPPPSAIPAHEPLPPGMRILVAEDHPINQVVVRRALVNLGCDVTIVENGKEAVEHLQAEPWDLVLMDCYMPVMDGFDATRAIRALDDAVAHIPIIALTASATTQDRQRVFDAGMNDLLAKPLEIDQLRRSLAAWARPSLHPSSPPPISTPQTSSK